MTSLPYDAGYLVGDKLVAPFMKGLIDAVLPEVAPQVEDHVHDMVENMVPGWLRKVINRG